MKKIELGQAITILANIGVLAGIVFLAIELQQNNQLLRAEVVNTSLQVRMNITELEMTNPALVEVFVKNDSGEPLTPEETRVMNASWTRMILAWQRDYLLFEEGILGREWLENNLPTMRRGAEVVGSHTLRDVWARQAATVSPEFREFMDNCVFASCESIGE